MSKYGISLIATASQWIEVEADSFQEAMDLAFEKCNFQPCHQEPFEMGDPEVNETGCEKDGAPIPEDER